MHIQNMYTVLHWGAIDRGRLTTEMRLKTPADDPKTPLLVVRPVSEKWQKLFRLNMVLHVYIFETFFLCLSDRSDRFQDTVIFSLLGEKTGF